MPPEVLHLTTAPSRFLLPSLRALSLLSKYFFAKRATFSLCFPLSQVGPQNRQLAPDVTRKTNIAIGKSSAKTSKPSAHSRRGLPQGRFRIRTCGGERP